MPGRREASQGSSAGRPQGGLLRSPADGAWRRLTAARRRGDRRIQVKALVTGAGGFIGAHVTAALAAAGAEVRALDLRPPADPPPGVEPVAEIGRAHV